MSTGPLNDLGLTQKRDTATAPSGGGCCGGAGGCMCGGHGSGASAAASSASVSSTSVVTELSVSGMTCEHCVKAVTEELSALGSVTNVPVELNPGDESRVTVTSEEPLETASVRAAVEDAGYTLA